tara:strand:+ start:157194 stop:157724 length:531 start_codon:yes stop_codon:yes gene_type:complete
MLRLIVPLLALCLFFATAIPGQAQAEKAPSINAQLVAYYGSAQNYRKVRRDVLKWHKTTTNGCVAFASTALRQIGYEVPIAAKRDGWAVSRITFAFSDYLEEAGWTRIATFEKLVPGDLAFTTGYPDHVFVFHSWANTQRHIARVLDNKGYLKRRLLSTKNRGDISGFAYGLRAPR